MVHYATIGLCLCSCLVNEKVLGTGEAGRKGAGATNKKRWGTANVSKTRSPGFVDETPTGLIKTLAEKVPGESSERHSASDEEAGSFDQMEEAAKGVGGKKGAASTNKKLYGIIMDHYEPVGKFDRYQAMADMASVGRDSET